MRPVVTIPVVLALAAAGAWAFVVWQETADAATARARVLADVDAALSKRPLDSGELARCTALLQKLPDNDTARDLLAAAARVELARDRPERADHLFGAVAAAPGATAAEQALGARILLRLHEVGAADGPRSAGVLQQVMTMGDAAYRERRDAGDLLCVWQAAERAGNYARSNEVAKELAANHAGAPETKFVQFAVAFDAGLGVAAVDAAAADLSPPPVEAAAMRAFAALQKQDLPGAVAIVDASLPRGAGVGVVRWAAAVVFHACALGSAEGSPERARWVERRNTQVDWVTAQPATDPARREQAAKMRQVN